MSNWYIENQDVDIKNGVEYVMEGFTYEFHFFLIVISILMIVSYAYVAFDFHEKAHIMTLPYRKFWVFGSSLAMGAGIWILQYLVLLGLSTADASFYAPWFVCLSLAVPVIGSLLAFMTLSPRGQFKQIIKASLWIALSLLLLQMISSHYLLGLTYSIDDWWRVVLPLLMVFFFTVSSLWLVYGISNERSNSFRRVSGALVFGLGTLAVHYFTMITSSVATKFEVESYSENHLVQYMALTGIFIISVLMLIRMMRNRELESQESMLRESERKYHSLVENCPDGIMVLDIQGHILNINPALERMSGYTLEQVSHKLSFHFVEERYIEQTTYCFERTKEGVPQKCESAISHRNGHSIHVKLISIPHMIENKMQGIIVIVEDITEFKETEELLRRSEKLTAVGELAAGVAHEIRNPLTSLKGFASLVYSSSHDEKSKEFLQIMLSEIDRINFIVSEFMLLARPHEKEFARSDLVSLLRHVISLLKSQAILKNIEIRTQYDCEEFPILGEENQLKQVFVNVLKNAIEAMEDGGIIYVKVTKCETGVTVRIKDQGVGIPEHQISRIGEPFYTLKENGTGLGLMVSFGIIDNHNGKMRLSSVEGKGTTVEVSLPLYERRLVKA
ncbi:ATP-binding protein [Guptibacillus sedimenti]|uniref:ATP-binding protein n=1 Tax=Guptibacillus sedimenti TaxID=3025680 RepID=UPI002362601A|nr:ATP-binding protein [Pseudalkalibacillus sedimenti]